MLLVRQVIRMIKVFIMIDFDTTKMNEEKGVADDAW
jgi:hypothetical protein